MPVARSDPRRVTVVAITAVLFGVAAVLLVLVLQNTDTRDTAQNISRSEVDMGNAAERAAAIAKERYPLGLNDPARFSRPIWLQHAGDDPTTGWLAFDAAIGTCLIQWDVDRQDFEDCEGRRYPADGEGLQHYLVQVTKNGRLVVNLNPDAVTSTTLAPTTTTILMTG